MSKAPPCKCRRGRWRQGSRRAERLEASDSGRLQVRGGRLHRQSWRAQPIRIPATPTSLRSNMSIRGLALAFSLFAAACSAHAQSVPLVMETMGLKIGQTAAEVEQVVRALGYKQARATAYPAKFGLPQRMAEVTFERQRQELRSEDFIIVAYGAMTGKLTAISRSETYAEPLIVGEVVKALDQKYGPHNGRPGTGQFGWVDRAAGAQGSLPGYCHAMRGTVNYMAILDNATAAGCKRAIRVDMNTQSDNPNVPFKQILVSMVDFETMAAEGRQLGKLLAQEREAELNKQKQQPLPKL
ncbi:hypothetical protein [Pelomonas cellulosilytica]|uniref:Lipoprotein n=1 Tax=Pelomonas cellulosilytica TaxID=2906762 RepID=A0ABS8XT66_9BURK|nr:hypothetical protein [Pelomonas sp. P8]MCE4555911.1 hypothetical protein [Pelomonas sp. P8]